MKKILLSLSALLMTAAAVNAQVYFHDDFENGLGQWTNVDQDGDGHTWQAVDFAQGDGHGAVANSQSWDSQDGPLTPNNYLISSAITLGTTNLILQYDVKGQDPDFSQEHYAVYVTTANDVATINASTPVKEETLPAQTTDYLTRTVDLSAFSGQTVYLTFRHYNITDMFSMNIDNIFIGKTTDLAMYNVDLPTTSLAGNINVKGTVKNAGTEPITSIDVSYDDGSGPVSQTFSSLNLLAGQTYDFTISTPYNFTGVANANMHVCATTANDSDPSNDCMDKTIAGVSSTVDKYVVVEENTGTWCGYCPRGTVALDNLHNNEPKAIEIAVHDNDPMTITAYDNACQANFPNFTGFPNSAIDRIIGRDPSQAAPVVNTRKALLPPASVSFDEAKLSGNTITVTPKVTMVSNLTGQYGIAVVIIEDSVKGTGSGWMQHNYYSSTANNEDLIDANGVNWKTLPGTVDQSTVFGGYNHVARALANNQFQGDNASLPGTLTDGQSYTYTYTINYNPSWDAYRLTAVAMFIDKTTGEVLNAFETPLTGNAGVAKESMNAMQLNVYPNPASNQANVTFTVASKSNAQVAVYDMTGKVVSSKALGSVIGKQSIKINTSQLQEGIYLVKVRTDKGVQTQRISVVK